VEELKAKTDRRHTAGPKISATNRKKYGPDYYSRIGSIGGRARVPKGQAIISQRKKNNEGKHE
jgi:hypothetical protein